MALNDKPRNSAEWARQVERRLRALEAPRSVRLGSWNVSVSPVSGSLVADHIPTGARSIIADASAETIGKEYE